MQGPATPTSYSFTPAKALPLDSEPGCWSAPELFFPDDNASQQIEAAKALCLRCPVRAACAELGKDERDGIWGGLTPTERRHPGRRRKLPPVPDARAGQRERLHQPPAHEPAPWMPPPRKKRKKRKRDDDGPLAQVIQFPMDRVRPHPQCPPNVDDCSVCYPDG